MVLLTALTEEAGLKMIAGPTVGIGDEDNDGLIMLAEGSV